MAYRNKDLSVSGDQIYGENDYVISNEKGKIRSQKKMRKVAVKADEKNTETLIITQKVEVKKQKIGCVINLNTSIYESQLKVNRKQCKKKDERKETFLERTVPKCSREQCISAVCNRMGCKDNKPHRKKSEHRTCKSKSKEVQTKDHKRKSKKTKHKKAKGKEVKINDKELSLSPISMSPLKSDSKEFQISYEEVSLDSFASHSDGNIDTLIKRTKNREKLTAVSSNILCENPLCTSTPHSVIEISSDEETLEDSKKDVSIHSLATVILDPPVETMSFSPTISHEYETDTLDHLHNYEEKLKYNSNNMSPPPEFMAKLLSNDMTNTICEYSDHELNWKPHFTNKKYENLAKNEENNNDNYYDPIFFI